LIAGLEAGRAVFRAGAPKLDDWTIGCGKIGNRDVIVSVNVAAQGPGRPRNDVVAAVMPSDAASTHCEHVVMQHEPVV
jgi:hypothetical protein